MNKNSFEDRFKRFVADEKLFSTDEKILLAVSGGVDSIVLMHLLHRMNVNLAAAHCNFQLRSIESDEDEAFVEKTAKDLGISFFGKKFETEHFAISHKFSIQEAARHLRYEWFEKLLLAEKFDSIATAHHLDDSIETVIFNLCNACGISGLHGIFPKNSDKNLIRPLTFATKKEILEYATANGIKYREDSSNSSEKYTRNLIRNSVIPLLKTVNQAFTENFSRSIRNFKETEILQHFAIKKIKSEITLALTGDELLKIDLSLLYNFPAPFTVLFEMLRPYGFNSSQSEQILQQANNTESAEYQSDSHIVIRNYKKLLVFKKTAPFSHPEILISSSVTELQIDFRKKLVLEYINSEDFIVHPPKKELAFFDADKIKFPLLLRFYNEADSFRPFGMKGKLKKISSFFKDEKIPHHYRSTIPLLLSDSKIIWVVGYRSSIDFAVTNDTQKVLKISIL